MMLYSLYPREGIVFVAVDGSPLTPKVDPKLMRKCAPGRGSARFGVFKTAP